MPRTALTPSEIEETRAAICLAASRLFAEHGYAGVTLRGIASEIGCSPMTPYRYFEDKAAIFSAVRRSAFDRFADALAPVHAGTSDPEARLVALAKVYVEFAVTESAAYRIMFKLDQSSVSVGPGLQPEEARAWGVLCDAIAAALEAGVIVGDRDTVAHLFWAGLHGLVSLHLAGKLQLGRDVASLTEPTIRALLDGVRFRH